MNMREIWQKMRKCGPIVRPIILLVVCIYLIEGTANAKLRMHAPDGMDPSEYEGYSEDALNTLNSLTGAGSWTKFTLPSPWNGEAWSLVWQGSAPTSSDLDITRKLYDLDDLSAIYTLEVVDAGFNVPFTTGSLYERSLGGETKIYGGGTRSWVVKQNATVVTENSGTQDFYRVMVTPAWQMYLVRAATIDNGTNSELSQNLVAAHELGHADAMQRSGFYERASVRFNSYEQMWEYLEFLDCPALWLQNAADRKINGVLKGIQYIHRDTWGDYDLNVPCFEVPAAYWDGTW